MIQNSPTIGARRGLWLAIALALCACSIVIVRSAWLCDEAFITLRTADNFVHGLGLTWNPEMRVQTYTHPLWMFLLTFSYWIVGEPYQAALGLSLVVTGLFLAAFVFVDRANLRGTLVALLGLAVSKTFVDYSTSGLEDPLAHLLVIVGYGLFWDGRNDTLNLRRVALLAALAGLTGLHHLVLFVPPLLVMIRRFQRERMTRFVLRPLLEGLAPLFAWLAFSLFYYGSSIPNVSLARLRAGAAPAEYVEQGATDLLATALADPLTAGLILFALGACCLPRCWPLLPAGAAIVLSLVFLVVSGGDAMLGRGLAPTVVLACAVIARVPLSSTAWTWVLALPLVVGGWLPPLSPLRADPEYGPRRPLESLPRFAAIRDARARTYPFTGLLRSRKTRPVDHPRAASGRDLRAELRTAARADRVRSTSTVGFFGFYAGPRARIIDELGHTDPLLARLPLADPSAGLVGSSPRELPAGYLETWTRGENRIEDPELARFHDHLALIVAGDLWNPKRLRAIFELHVGIYDPLVDTYVQRR